MDLGALDLHAGFWAGLGSIVVIDLVLAGDNAVVIAMAVRNLPTAQRRKGILLGAGAAVVLRVAVTFFVSQLLSLPFVKLGGGLLIIWVALKLFAGEDVEERSERKASSIWEAVKLIVVADITMSVDNMLAVGGASHGNIFLLLFGLGLSIPFIVFTSELLSQLMGRFPVIVFAGAAILGKVSAEMVLTDPIVASRLGGSHALLYAGEAAMAAAIVAYGWSRSRRAPEPVAVAEPGAAEPPAGRTVDR
ncbi:MAG TPA: TerC family protein [Anaeromyxobacteraceae bacterium]|nr:TerC family protein [Anaeromyxobacteraceae bacterium]